MNEEFKPSLHLMGGFDGKTQANYNEFTQYLSLTIAKGGKSAAFNGIVNNQKEVDDVIEGMLKAINYKEAETPVENEVKEPVKKAKK